MSIQTDLSSAGRDQDLSSVRSSWLQDMAQALSAEGLVVVSSQSTVGQLGRETTEGTWQEQ